MAKKTKKPTPWYLKRAGRPPKFECPEELWQAAVEYFEYTDTRTVDTQDWVGKDAKEVTKKIKVPYTLASFCLFIEVGESFFRNFKNSELYKSDARFSTVYTCIEKTIYAQKFEGAAAGRYNANIIARDLGLRDKSDVTTEYKPITQEITSIKIVRTGGEEAAE